VQTSEECDDGNTVPLDGCEPSTCVKSGIIKIAAGDGHACALCRGGYVRCWGVNDHGELGLGHVLFQANKHPYQTLDAAGNLGGYVNLGGVAATDIAAGFGFTCALLTDGSVRCWGMNNLGQLGLGNTSSTPPQIGAAISFGNGITAKAISASVGYACAILSNNTIRCWGDNSTGALGLGNTSAVLSGTVALPTSPAPVAISTGSDNACVLLSGGLVHCWGDNHFGEFGLGNSATLPDSTSTLPSAYDNASLAPTAASISISVGGAFNCARLTNGSAECWGANDSGQLGIGNVVTIGDTQVPGNTGVVQIGAVPVASIVASVNFSCAILGNEGGLKCWGNNSRGQLGYGDFANRGNTGATIPLNLSPVGFPAGMTVIGVYLGNAFTCALMVDATNTTSVRCWGSNNRGQLGLAKVSTSVGGIAAETPDKLSAVQVFPP
jgi:cysteine-rich repeat protein